MAIRYMYEVVCFPAGPDAVSASEPGLLPQVEQRRWHGSVPHVHDQCGCPAWGWQGHSSGRFAVRCGIRKAARKRMYTHMKST